MFDKNVNVVNNKYKGRSFQMKTHAAMLNAVKYICGTLVFLGIAIFSYGVYVSDYQELVGIGVGTVMSAAFIWIMGTFLVVTEEMIHKPGEGKRSVL